MSFQEWMDTDYPARRSSAPKGVVSMDVATGGRLRLHFRKDPTAGFLPLLQKGCYINISTGNLIDMLCLSCGLDAEQVRGRIQTLVLNGKPVDDMAGTHVHDGDCLALSAAMPGLVGATMRSGGILAGFRRTISHRDMDDGQTDTGGGLLLIKLFNLCPSRNRTICSRSRRVENLTAGIWLIFRGLNFPRNADIGQIGHFWMGTNLLIAEMGPRFLQQGILVSPDDLRDLLGSSTQLRLEDCCKAELDSRQVEIDTLAAIEWDPGKGPIRLEVAFG